MRQNIKQEILSLLNKESADFFSSKSICEGLNISRSAVWKAVCELRKEGYAIEGETNHGYRLIPGCEALNESEFLRHLSTKTIGRKVIIKDTTKSTNDDLKNCCQKGESHGLVEIAKVQQGGKGRRGRSWDSPDGCLAMSILLRPDIAVEVAPRITLIAALAVHKALVGFLTKCKSEHGGKALHKGRESTPLLTPIPDCCSHSDKALHKDRDSGRVSIKWPNDVLIDEKKVCGILSEMSVEMSEIEYIVVGIGINVNLDHFSPELSASATSLSMVTGRLCPRAEIAARICNVFEGYYESFVSDDLNPLPVDEYNAALANMNRSVRVLDPKGEYDAVAKGISPAGQLIVEANGDLLKLSSGDVSIRGIMGYA